MAWANELYKDSLRRVLIKTFSFSFSNFMPKLLIFTFMKLIKKIKQRNEETLNETLFKENKCANIYKCKYYF
jgi:hypothetical protein